jgi:hypothetical protein
MSMVRKSVRTRIILCVSLMSFLVGLGTPRQSWSEAYPAVKEIRRSFLISSVANTNVSLDIDSENGKPLYHLQCHTAGYTGDPDFDYSGDFECRLSIIGEPNSFSTLLTENARQSRDWESRGRFFAIALRDPCARIPEFGASRNFKLRGMGMNLQITDSTFTEAGKLKSLKLTVAVRHDPMARRPIAEIVPLPPADQVPGSCQLRKYFVDNSAGGN